MYLCYARVFVKLWAWNSAFSQTREFNVLTVKGRSKLAQPLRVHCNKRSLMQRGGKGENVIKLLYCLYIPLKEAAVFHRVYKKRTEGLEPATQAEGEEKTEARDEFISGMELGSQENIQERYVFIFIHKINACLCWKYLQADIERGTTNSEEIEELRCVS